MATILISDVSAIVAHLVESQNCLWSQIFEKYIFICSLFVTLIVANVLTAKIMHLIYNFIAITYGQLVLEL
jgi:hypothetical protein